MLKFLNTKFAERKNRQDNARWEKLDYSQEKEATMIAIISEQKYSDKTLQRIIETAKPGFITYYACQEKAAQVEDILNFIFKVHKEYPAFIRTPIYNEIVNYLFVFRREQLDAHLQTAYEIDSKNMPAIQIQEMLNITFLGVTRPILQSYKHSLTF
jgi:hypothetical protein